MKAFSVSKSVRRASMAFMVAVPLVLTACGDDDNEAGNAPMTIEQLVQKEERDWRYPREGADLPEDLRLVTENYGMPVVKEGSFEFKSDVRPWSSWWYPTSRKELFDGKNSPLQKYDAVVEEVSGEASQAASYHRSNRYNPMAVSWDGLCDAWSLASIYENEPKRPAMIGGVCFSPAEMKALAIMTYEQVNPDNWSGWYGQRNDNRFEDIYTDIYPEQFHRFIQVQLGERGAPFVMDHDPGAEVWSQSVYQARGTITRRADRDDVVDVTVLLSMAKYQLNERERRQDNREGVGTIPMNRQYTYELYGEWRGDKFHVSEGLWAGYSVEDHPDFVIEVPQKKSALGERGSFNPQIQVKWVDWILEQAQSAPSCDPE